jgi:hypothetical protein
VRHRRDEADPPPYWQRKGYRVATRNLGDFRQTGLILVNPSDAGTRDDSWDDDPLSPLLDSE